MALRMGSSSALVGLLASPALAPIRSGGLGIGCCAGDLSTDSPLARLTAKPSTARASLEILHPISLRAFVAEASAENRMLWRRNLRIVLAGY